MLYIHIITCIQWNLSSLHMLCGNEVSRHGKYVYSTLALIGKEREIVQEETALRKEKEAVHVHVDIQIGRHGAWI